MTRLTAAEVFVKVPWTIEDIVVDSVLKTYPPNVLNLGYNIASGYRTFVAYRVDSIIDSTPPYEFHRFNFTWTINSESVPTDIFSQDDFGLPNLDAYGWKYKGWILSNGLDTSVVPTRFTDLAWPVEGALEHRAYSPLQPAGCLLPARSPTSRLPTTGIRLFWPVVRYRRSRARISSILRRFKLHTASTAQLI